MTLATFRAGQRRRGVGTAGAAHRYACSTHQPGSTAHNSKTIGLGIGAFTFGALAVLVGVAVGRGRGAGLSGFVADKLPAAVRDRLPAGLSEGHVAADLAAGTDLGPDHRAPEAFRPDMDAPMTPAEREALRPATGPAPSLVADDARGFAEAAGAA